MRRIELRGSGQSPSRSWLRAGASRQRHANAPHCAGGTLGTHRDLHVTPESRKESHQSFYGEAFQATVDQRGHLGLVDAQDSGRACLGQVTLFQNLLYLDGQQDLGPSLLGIRKAEVREYVAGALVDFNPRELRLAIAFLVVSFELSSFWDN